MFRHHLPSLLALAIVGPSLSYRPPSRIGLRRPSLSLGTTTATSAAAAATTTTTTTTEGDGPAARAVRTYFDAWNRRDMAAACAMFSEDCEYEDTQYSGSFVGRAALEKHLFKVADALPDTFQFCLDDIADGGNIAGVQWHVENDGKELPFTRGCSMYRADPATG